MKKQFFFIFLLLLNSINNINALNNKLTSIFESVERLTIFTEWTGKKQTVDVFFTNWCEGSLPTVFDSILVHMWTNQSVPLITWQMENCDGSGPAGITKLVNQNVYDSYINEFSDRLKKWLSGNDGIYGTNDDRRAYLRLAHEMNGNWYPWSKNATPSDYIRAWQHVYKIFSSKNIDSTRLQWIWCVNNADVGEYKAEEYWVGEEYVDWIGIDGYNFGASQTWSSWVWPQQVFDTMIARVRKLSLNKPLSINEYGCTSMITPGISNVAMKTEWLNRFCNYIDVNSVKMASYFNIEKETDWSIFGGQHGDAVWKNLNVYSAYRNCLQTNSWIESNSTNPRLITDEQFAGKI